jgi:hypothetical protein
MFFIGLRQQSSPPHYQSRRKLHLVTVRGDHAGMEPLFSGEPGSGHVLGPWSRGHDFAFRHHDDGRFRGRGFDRDDRFFHRHRFFADFRFFGFGYPYDWYPDYYYYGYPYDYSYYDYSPVYGDRYSSNLAIMTNRAALP